MSEPAGTEGPTEDAVGQDDTARVREQTANDIGSTDAFGPEDDRALEQDG
jgi:hypothetical protein